MKRVDGTTTEFICEKNEIVTINITEKNTGFMVSVSPQTADIIVSGKTITINVGNSIKIVTLGFDFNATGGFYTQVLAGSKGGSFTRRVLQPTDDLPEVRTYVFHV